MISENIPIESPSPGTKPSTQQRSHLLDLPTELRLSIYSHYFQGSKQCMHCPASHPRNPSTLLLTSKQISHEAKEFYYKHCTFSFRRKLSIPWFKSIPARYRNTITYIRLYDTCDVKRTSNPRATPWEQKYLLIRSERKIRRAGGHVVNGVIQARAKRGNEWVWVTAEWRNEK